MGLADQLTPAEVAAVLEHERAHVRGRHHLLLAAAETVAGALPFLPLAREAPTALRDLVELAADATAARHCGARVLHDALTKVTGLDLPPSALAAGNHAIDVRLGRLTETRHVRGRAQRTARAAAVGAASITAPSALAAVVMTVVLTLCP